MIAQLLLVASHDLLERPSEFLVEDRVEDRIYARVGISEPEEERIQLSRYEAVGTASSDRVDREESEPHAAEESDDDCHPDGSPHLALFVPLTLAHHPGRLAFLDQRIAQSAAAAAPLARLAEFLDDSVQSPAERRLLRFQAAGHLKQMFDRLLTSTVDRHPADPFAGVDVIDGIDEVFDDDYRRNVRTLVDLFAVVRRYYVTVFFLR